jgi:hypothetical protein
MQIKEFVHHHIFCFMLTFTTVLLGVDSIQALGETISVQAAVEQNEVCVGEAFIFQIKIDGNDSPKTPDLSGISNNDFDVRSLGGQTTNRESVTIINGDMNRDVHRGYVYSYQLTPKREGTFMIPSLQIQAGNGTIKTQPIQIHVGKPQENESFKLRLTVSREKCYVNEPVVLTETWYISMNVRDANFTLPILDNKSFTVIDPETQPDPQKKYAQIPLAGTVTLAEVGQGILDGKTYTTIQFQKILMPREPGTFKIPQATVSCSAMVGMGARDPFSSDSFFGGPRGSLKRFVTPSNHLTLTVLDLPAQGKPVDFSGLVGSYTIEATAAPTEVNVGDPITLTLRITGADYLKPLELPSLNQQPAMARNFKIPEEMAPGKLEGNAKVFTQTIRAIRPDVKEIPPIELSYFDSTDGRYKVVRTKSIQLNVKGTKVVTLQDAEGREPTQAGSELKVSRDGIAYNYEDTSVLENQNFGLKELLQSPFYLALGIVPPTVYGLLLTGVVVYRRRQADPAGVKSRRAYRELSKRINGCLKKNHNRDSEAFSDLLEAARYYLGDKLRLPAGALTWGDVEPCLTKQSVDPEIIRGLKSIFDDCEAHRYTKLVGSFDDLSATAQRLSDLARKLERSLK